MRKKINVIQSKDEPEIPADILAEHITEISKGMLSLNRSRLKRDTIILLLHDMTKIARRNIARVLNAMEQLEEIYLKPKPQKK